MTERRGEVVILAVEKPQTCELCGKEKETRPFGPNGEEVCLPCAMKNPAAERAFQKMLNDASN